MSRGHGISGMTATEKRAAVSLAGVFSLRMLGLFLILPVFALYAEDLAGNTPLLIGVAIGAYGLTQAILQIPFGLLSDHIGRKPVIVGGLILFAVGSVVAALADTMYGVILGRALQGSGAIAAAVMALAADLTREEQRTKAMAMIGMSIGMAFAIALVAGPSLGAWIGVQGIFWLTAALALAGVAIVVLVVPRPLVSRVHRDAEPVPKQFGRVLRDANLLRLDAGILILHMILTAGFVVIPVVLRDSAGLDSADHWQVYLPVLLASVVAMVPFIIMAERHRRMKQVFLGAVLLLGLAEFGLSRSVGSLTGMVVMLWLFFTAFNLLEAMLPSLVSKTAPVESKGTAMGVYSSGQFLGAFLGGLLGGWVLGQFGTQGVFLLCAGLALVWGVIALGMGSPRYLSSYLLRVGNLSDGEAQRLVSRLTRVRGVAEAVVIAEDGVAYLRVDRHALDEEALGEFSVAEA